jgi:hypothetical protein
MRLSTGLIIFFFTNKLLLTYNVQWCITMKAFLVIRKTIFVAEMQPVCIAIDLYIIFLSLIYKLFCTKTCMDGGWGGGGAPPPPQPPPTPPQKSPDFQGPPLPVALEIDLPPSKSLRPVPYKQKGTLIVIFNSVKVFHTDGKKLNSPYILLNSLLLGNCLKMLLHALFSFTVFLFC